MSNESPPNFQQPEAYEAAMSERRRTSRTRTAPEEVGKSQRMFLTQLAKKMDENGHSIEDLSNAIDVPYSYIIAIKNGLRRIAKADETTVEKFAHYLDVPLVQIYIWGGFFKPIDFVAKRTLNDGLNQAFERMSHDPMMATIVPPAEDWNNDQKWSNEAKLTIVRLYELVSNQFFLKHANMTLDEDTEQPFLNYLKKF